MDARVTFKQVELALLEAWEEHPTRTAVCAAALISVIYLVGLTIYRVWFHPLAAFPGPKAYAITSFPQQCQNYLRGNWARNTRKLHSRYGPVVRIGPNHLALDGSIAWPQVFANHPGRPEFSKLSKFYGDNNMSVIGSSREVHRRQRRQLAHAFSESALYEQQGIVLRYADRLMDKLSEIAAKGENANMVNWLNYFTFDVIGDLTFAESFGSLENSDYHPWVRTIVDSVRGTAMAAMAVLRPAFFPLLPLFVGMNFIKAAKEAMVLGREMAKTRIEQGEQEGRRDFMTYMTRKNRDGEQGMTYEEQLWNSPLLVAAGSETTGTALAGFFFFLGNRRHLVQNLTEEIRGAFASEAEIEFRSLARLPLLQACLEETLRLYPPAVEIPPRVSPGALIEDKYVPAGTLCSVFQYATYRNPDHFADPEEFRPERWLPSTHPLYNPKYANDNRSVFKPFSYGSRDCVGKNLAYSEMRLIVSRIFFRFDWELAPGQGDWFDKQLVFLVWQKDPLWVSFKDRTSQASVTKALHSKA